MNIEQQKEYIRKHYLSIPIKRIARHIGRSQTFVRSEMKRQGLVVPPALAAARKRRSQFEKGQPAFNKGKKQHEFMSPEAIERTKKTRFKPGNEPHNTKYDYAISSRIDSNGNRYYWIRIEKAHWVLLHRYLWELAYGSVPEGHLVQFKDGNSQNVHLDNLYLTTRDKQAVVNKLGGHDIPYELRKTINLIYQLKSEINEKQDHRSQ